jgi:hypothetical protein
MIREIKVSKMVVYSVLNDIKQGRCRIAMYIFILHTKQGMIKKARPDSDYSESRLAAFLQRVGQGMEVS